MKKQGHKQYENMHIYRKALNSFLQQPQKKKTATVKCLFSCCFQVVETVRVFVTDVNDEPPKFQNLPFIIDVPEVPVPSHTHRDTAKANSE